MACGRQFRGRAYLTGKEVWEAYSKEKQTIHELSAKFNVSDSTIKRLLKDVRAEWADPVRGGNVIINIDATYFGRTAGVLVALNTKNGAPLYLRHLRHEHVSDYVEAVRVMERNGYRIDGIVIDGMQGLFREFAAYKVQMCQYHMCAIVRRKITKNPKLEAGMELKRLMLSLKDSMREDFTNRFYRWKDKWRTFLNQRTVNNETGRTSYTHRRIRSAMNSIEFYLPWLFTYEDVEGMPNTNNKIEGTFTKQKNSMNNYSGMSKENRRRFVDGFFLALNDELQP